MYKEYLDIADSKGNCNKIKIDMSYNLGGRNFFSGENEARGYYLHCQALEVKKEDNVIYECFTPIKGAKALLLETKRKSIKSENEAIKIAEVKKQELLNYVLKQNQNLKLL